MTTFPAPWREVLIERMRGEARPLEKLSHQPRLYRLTKQIGAGLSYSDDVVFAAAWVHDLGVFTGHRPEEAEALRHWDSTAYTLAAAPALLAETGLPRSLLSAVLECIRTHEAHAQPGTIEATILRDADILEQLGAVGAVRTLCKIGRDTRYATFSDAVATLERALSKLPPLLRLDRSRDLAEPRISVLRGFLDALQEESEGEL